MKTPYFVFSTNSQASRIVEDRATLEHFAAAASSQLADLLVVVGNTDADEGFIKGTLELAADLAYQLQQACAALRDGPERHRDEDWQALPRSYDDASMQITTNSDAAKDPDAFLPTAAASLIDRTGPLLQDAMNLGEGGDAGGRCISAAMIQLDCLLQSKPGFRGGDFDPLDMLYDAESILEGVAALHPADGRGGIVRLALEQLSKADGVIDAYRLAQPSSPEPAPVAAALRRKKKAVTA